MVSVIVSAVCLGADKPASIDVAIGSGDVAVFRLISPKTEQIDYVDFYLQETEVTNAQFQRFLIDSRRTKDDSRVLEIVEQRRASRRFSTGDIPYRVEDPSAIWQDGKFPDGEELFPVCFVTLEDATDFCKWLSEKHPKLGVFRLPTWNAWMIAAYGRDRPYPWGKEWGKSKVHGSFGHTFETLNERPKRTEPVKARPAGKTPQGLFGMLGNASEFIHPEDPRSANHFDLAARWMGGGFTDGYEFGDKPAVATPRQDYWGYSHHSNLRQCDLGFRVVLDPSHNETLLKRPRLFPQNNRAWETQ